MVRVFTSIALGLMLVWIAPLIAEAQTVARVVGYTEQATVQRGGQRLAVRNNLALSSGDRIRTSASGEVQIAFVDRTRVIVGPNADFRIRDVQVSAGQRASRFAVRALGGSFRFLSGDSAKPVYEIRTPSVTMGIRGTDFDFVVPSRRQTSVATYSGEVQVCNRNNRCARVFGGCGVVSVRRAQFDIPETDEDKLNLLASEFRFVAGQNRLPREFRVATGSCGDVEAAVAAIQSAANTPASTTATDDRNDPGRSEGGDNSGDGGGESSGGGTGGGNAGGGNSGGGSSGGGSSDGGGSDSGGGSEGYSEAADEAE